MGCLAAMFQGRSKAHVSTYEYDFAVRLYNAEREVTTEDVEMSNFLLQCFVIDSNQRPSAATLGEHAWLKFDSDFGARVAAQAALDETMCAADNLEKWLHTINLRGVSLPVRPAVGSEAT